MRSRTSISFWASTLASVLLLGSLWRLKARIGMPGFGPGDVVLMAIAATGLLGTFFVAGRIAYVVGKVRRSQPAVDPDPR